MYDVRRQQLDQNTSTSGRGNAAKNCNGTTQCIALSIGIDSTSSIWALMSITSKGPSIKFLSSHMKYCAFDCTIELVWIAPECLCSTFFQPKKYQIILNVTADFLNNKHTTVIMLVGLAVLVAERWDCGHYIFKQALYHFTTLTKSSSLI